MVEQLTEDWRLAKLSEGDRAMLTYVEKLTLRPWDMIEEDVIAFYD